MSAAMGRYVPLAEVQQRFGELVGKAKLAEPFPPPPREARAAVRRALAASAEPGKDRRRRGQPGKDGSVVPASALAVVAGWSTYGAGGGEHPGRRSFQQRQQDVATHSRCTGQIVEMKHLETELDITFRIASEFCAPCWAQDPAPGGGASILGFEDVTEEDVVLQLELTGNPFCTSRAITGKAQGLLVRSHCSWELKAPDAAAEPVANSGWRASVPSRPTTPSLSLTPPAGTGPSEAAGRPRLLGDTAHALRLDLRERVPETLILTRVQPRDGRDTSAEGRPPTSSDANTKALAFLRETEEQCKRLEGSIGQKLNAHCDMLALRSEEDAAGAEAAAGADTEAVGETSGAPSGSVQGYLRELRAVLRALGPGLPSAARLLESAVKGLVLAVDSELATAARRIKRLEGQVAQLDTVVEESDSLKQMISDMRKEYDHMQEKLATADKKHEVENRALRDRIEALKVEIQRLTPDQGQVEGMTGLMADYQVLMSEMEEECGRQNKILRDLTNHTAGIMRDANREQQTQNGRVVELKNGEVMLRSYNVAEQATQVTEAELLRQDPTAPVRLWRPPVRQILVAFEEQEVPSISLEDLCVEVDKIYTAKITADLEADAAGLPRSELANFIVEYYLDLLGSVRLAQQKFVSIVECIHSLEKNPSTPTPSKVAMFARFLEVCHYEAALPLTVLNVVLQAKSLVSTKLEQPMVSFNMRHTHSNNSRRRDRLESGSVSIHATGSMRSFADAEPQVGVAVAYQAAVRALPSKGSFCALRELFIFLSRSAEVEGVDSRRNGNLREFYCLMQILHDCLQGQSAPMLRDLITRAEQRHLVSADEFREAVKDARVLGVDDVVWRTRLCPTTGPTLSSELFLDYLGGGSLARLPRAAVSEGSLLEAVVDAMAVDYSERSKHLERMWQRHASSSNGPLTYAEFKTVLQSAEPSLSPPMIRTLFLTSVETSRSCSQQEGNYCSRRETLEPSPSGEFGGEIVTFKLLALAALRWQLFLKEGPRTAAIRYSMSAQQTASEAKGSPRRPISLGSAKTHPSTSGSSTTRRTSGEAKNAGRTTPRRTPRAG